MRFFDPSSHTDIHLNRLPHWEQEEATYFATWRLKDSIPRNLIDKLFIERAAWENEHPKPWTTEQETEYHTLFSGEIDRMLDMGSGECFLRRDDCRHVLEQSLMIMNGKKYLMHSWVAMPNHVHVLFSIANGESLEKVIGSWKSYSTKNINSLIGGQGALWQRDYYDRMIRDWNHLIRVARYIRNNPKKAKLGACSYTLYEADWVKEMLS